MPHPDLLPKPGAPHPHSLREPARQARTDGRGIGEPIGVDADDPAARLDVPAWRTMRGHEYVGEDAAPDGVPVHTVRRGR